MWADNETNTDLLGFSVHKDLIRQLVTNEQLLPLTVGVFGDWGGGKSSILRMLQQDLNDENSYPDVACLYFSGWMFEGYDDAKAALITSVLLQLGEHKKFGPKVRDHVVPLLKRVDLMRVLPFFAKRAGPAVAAAAIGGAAAYFGLDPSIATALSVGGSAALGSTAAIGSAGTESNAAQSDAAESATDADEDRGSNGSGDEEVDWKGLLSKDKTKASPMDIRTFQRDFEKLLKETNLRTLVVLVDDLDRCMPDRLIENLEAIRLFLAVPKTAFVIAADYRIVRHAVSVRFAAPRLGGEQPGGAQPYDLVTDYIEKLIQIPYNLPRLSPSEIETYTTLLFCQLHLGSTGQFETVVAHCDTARQKNLYLTYGAGLVRDALQGTLPDDLARRLQWTGTVAPAFTESLKGNPRQVKRFLNALMLRSQLAEVARLQIKDDVLVKLMLLEYSRPTLFDDLYVWQARSEGRPPELRELEHRASNAGITGSQTPAREEATTLTESITTKWSEQPVQDWLVLEPRLGDIDLRDYFWIARDRLQKTVTGLTMVPPFVRQLFEGLISPNPGERDIAAKDARQLEASERAELFHLLEQQVRREPNGRTGVDGLLALIGADMAGAVDTLMAAISTLPAENIEPSIPFELQTLITEGKVSEQEARRLLTNWSATHTPAGAAATSAAQDLDRKRTARN